MRPFDTFSGQVSPESTESKVEKTDFVHRVQYDTVVAVNRRLQLHIEFLTDLFATRDANNRREIERLEAIAVNQGTLLRGSRLSIWRRQWCRGRKGQINESYMALG